MDTHEPLQTIRTPEIIDDPYPFYAQLRDESPVVQDPSSIWFCARYLDVLEALTSDDVSAQRLQRGRRLRPDAGHPDIRALYEQLSLQILFLDPPHHTRLRAIVSKAFTPKFVQSMRPTIQRIVDQLLEAPLASAQLDVIQDLALPLPMRVICDMLNIPQSDRASLKLWSADYAEFLGGAPVLPHDRMLQIAKSLAAYMRYFRELSAVRIENPGDDLLSALLRAGAEEGAVEREAVCATAVLLITAGHETTTNLIGNGLLALLRKPDVLEQLRQNPASWPSAVEELLRFDSPVQFVVRRVARDMRIGEQRIEAEALICLLVGSANRDPRRFESPDQLVLSRPKNRHLAFGQGPHYCIGAALARLEAQIALCTLFERVEAMHALDPRPRWVQNPVLRGLQSFPLGLQLAK